ncbi:MAG: hypothetical protein WA970_15110 [Gammaproteobacteria bacterium]
MVPMSLRVRALLEPWFALNDRFPVGPRQAQKIVKAIANRAKISREVTPHVLKAHFCHPGPEERLASGRCRAPAESGGEKDPQTRPPFDD